MSNPFDTPDFEKPESLEESEKNVNTESNVAENVSGDIYSAPPPLEESKPQEAEATAMPEYAQPDVNAADPINPEQPQYGAQDPGQSPSDAQQSSPQQYSPPMYGGGYYTPPSQPGYGGFYTQPHIIPDGALPKNQVPVNSASLNSDFESQDQVIAAPRRELTEEEIKEIKKNRTGMKVFCILLVLVIAASSFLAAGYYLGRSYREANAEVPGIVEAPSTDDMQIYEVAEKIKPSIVGISVYSDDASAGRGEASGIVLNEEGYILTNDHIYEGIADAKFIIKTYDGKEYAATFFAGDRRSDLALLKVDVDIKLTPAEFGDSDKLIPGQKAVAIGYPGGISENATVTDGIISDSSKRVANSSSYSMKLVQHNAAINPGSSGGALVNMHGQVIGVNSSKIVAEGYEGIGFAIPSVTARKNADDLLKHGRVTGRSQLGITYIAIDSVSAIQNNCPTGLRIQEVKEVSDLFGKAKKDEIITQINGEVITDSNKVLDIIETKQPGDLLTFTISKFVSDGKTGSWVDREETAKLLEDEGSTNYVKSK